MTTTVRISEQAHARLVALSRATGRRMQTIVDEAIAAYETTEFWKAFDAGVEALASDRGQSAEVQAERAGEAGVLSDGLD